MTTKNIENKKVREKEKTASYFSQKKQHQHREEYLDKKN